MQGVYSIAEIVNSCWQAQIYGTTVNRVVFCVIRNVPASGTWTAQQIKSFKATMTLCRDIAPERFCGDFVNSVVDVLDLMHNNGVIKLK